jgi:dCMP deaminase
VKMIMSAGIGEVRYAGGYPDPLAMEVAAEGGLTMVRFEGESSKANGVSN